MNAQLAGPDYGLQADFPDNLAEQIRDGVTKYPDASLIELTPEGRSIQTTSRRLHERALNVCEQIASIPPEVPLILCFERAVDFVPAAWAATFLGRWYLPWQITPASRAGAGVGVRVHAMRQCFAHACLLFKAGSEFPGRNVMQMATTWSSQAIDVDPEAAGADAALSLVQGGGCYLPTSGSSGGAKFARIRNSTLCGRFRAAQDRGTVQTSLVSLPFDGVSGHVVVFPWKGTRVFLPTASLMTRPDELPELIRRFGINSLPLSTTMLSKVVDVLESRVTPCDLSVLERFSLGAEPISALLVGRLIRQCRRFEVTGPRIDLSYGMTETGTLASIGLPSPDAALTHLDDSREAVRLGGCTRFTGLRVTDADDRSIEEGLPGQIQVHAPPRLFDGYQTPSGLDRSCFTADGWFRTGDQGLIESGQLIVFGRASGSMRLGGRTFSSEQIETALGNFEGLEPGALIAAPVRPDGAVADELAVFYSPAAKANGSDRELGQRLKRAVTELIGFTPKHLVPVPSGRIARTASAKVIRPELVRAYLAGEWVALASATTAPDVPLPLRQRLRQLWAKQLRIEAVFSDDAGFFELGADSLAVAEMVFAVEREFGVRLPLQIFFRRPTFEHLVALVSSPATDRPAEGDSSTSRADDLVRKLESALTSWSGHRPRPSSLLPVVNADGTAVPLFWVFQSEEEFHRLGAALGADCPLYGLRSLVGFLPIREHDANVLNAVCDRYLPEILAAKSLGPIVLGGNCQGGIHALALARRLRRLGRAPTPLVLMEWSFDWGPYEGDVDMLYGDQSYTARFYTQDCAEGPNWRLDFRPRGVRSISGGHGEFFLPHNVASLATELRRICVRAGGS